VLWDEGVKCTIFVTGQFVRRYPELITVMAHHGHEIGNHTRSHPDLCVQFDPMPAEGVTEAAFKEELLNVERSLRAILGSEPVRLWRAPFGHRNSRILSWARECGYQHVGWSVDSDDWRIGFEGNMDAAATFDRALDAVLRIRPGERGAQDPIVLCHLASNSPRDPTYHSIQSFIRHVKAAGWTFTTVSSTLGASVSVGRSSYTIG
jgi:peptidoglycan/xylan/chitin deacetylase (PgdA/CDA1 family)